MSRNNYTIGLIIVIVGVAILLAKFGFFSFVGGFLWPIFILLPGIAFHMLFFSNTLPSGVLIPGGILTTYSLMFFYCNIFGWSSMSYLWPGFIFGVAVGLYEFYLFDRYHPRGVLIASAIVGLVSAVMFGVSLLFTSGIYFIALVLIVVGLFVMMRRPNAW